MSDTYGLALLVYWNQIMAILENIFMLLNKVHVQVAKHFNMKEELRDSVFRINRW